MLIPRVGSVDRPVRILAVDTSAEAAAPTDTPPISAAYPLLTDTGLRRQRELFCVWLVHVMSWRSSMRGGTEVRLSRPQVASTPFVYKLFSTLPDIPFTPASAPPPRPPSPPPCTCHCVRSVRYNMAHSAATGRCVASLLPAALGPNPASPSYRS